MAEMQAVTDEQLRPRLAVGTQHRAVDVDVPQAVVRIDHRANQCVGLAHLFDQAPAPQAGLDGDERNSRLGQGVMNGAHEGLEIVADGLRRLAAVNVVVAGVEDDRARCVGKDDARREVNRIDDLRAAIGLRSTEIDRFSAEREAYDKSSLMRGGLALGATVLVVVTLVVILSALF